MGTRRAYTSSFYKALLESLEGRYSAWAVSKLAIMTIPYLVTVRSVSSSSSSSLQFLLPVRLLPCLPFSGYLPMKPFCQSRQFGMKETQCLGGGLIQ